MILHVGVILRVKWERRARIRQWGQNVIAIWLFQDGMISHAPTWIAE